MSSLPRPSPSRPGGARRDGDRPAPIHRPPPPHLSSSSSPASCRHGHPTPVTTTQATRTTAPTSPSSTLAALPPSVQPVTVHLATPDADVYVLGVSHVSQRSADHVRDLITHVKPDAVLLELCKDRTGLLTESYPPTDPTDPLLQWTASEVVVEGNKDGTLSDDEVRAMLRCASGLPFLPAADLEADV